MIKVAGHKNLYRDENSGAIVNCDTIAYRQYLNQVNAKNEQKFEIEQIKQDITEIKNLLKELLNGPL